MTGKYKLLVLDLDGTLTNSQKVITPHTKAALMEAQEKGVRIVLASGRPTYGIVPLAEELELQHHGGFILAYNGGKIIQWENREVCHEKVLPDHILPYLYQSAGEAGFPILTYENEYILTEFPEDEYIHHEAFINKMRIKKVEHFLEEVPRPLPKCLIVGHEEPLARLEKKMQAEAGEQMEIYRSAPFFLELVPKGIDKAQSLDVLISRLGIGRQEILACGDGYNDISMIEFAGLGVAMDNAQPEVKAKADYITLSNEEDGVAHVINRFIFGRNPQGG